MEHLRPGGVNRRPSPQLPAFCRTRRRITTTVRLNTLQQLLWLLLLVVFLQLSTILLVLAGPVPAPLRPMAVPLVLPPNKPDGGSPSRPLYGVAPRGDRVTARRPHPHRPLAFAAMNSTTALVPYAFEGHRIRVSTDQRGEAWFVAADVCTALAQHPIARALTSLREEEHCLHSQEGPGSEGGSLGLISEGGLLRLLVRSDNPTAWRVRRWLTHEVFPAIQRTHQHSAPLEGRTIDAIRRQTAAEVLRAADEIIHLTGVSHAEALLSALEGIQTKSANAPDPALQGACCSPRHDHPGQGEPLGQSPRPRDWRLLSEHTAVAWLTAEQVADRLDHTLRGTNQRLEASGLQVHNEDDDWQLTEAGRDWGVTLPLCSRGERRQQILWDPAVVALLHQTN